MLPFVLFDPLPPVSSVSSLLGGVWIRVRRGLTLGACLFAILCAGKVARLRFDALSFGCVTFVAFLLLPRKIPRKQTSCCEQRHSDYHHQQHGIRATSLLRRYSRRRCGNTHLARQRTSWDSRCSLAQVSILSWKYVLLFYLDRLRDPIDNWSGGHGKRKQHACFSPPISVWIVTSTGRAVPAGATVTLKLSWQLSDA